MAVITISSRWVGVPIVANNDGHRQFDFRRTMVFRHLTQMDRIIVGEKDTLHHIAFRLYGQTQYWWALAEFNDIFDVTTELEAGMELFVPTLDEVSRAQAGTP